MSSGKLVLGLKRGARIALRLGLVLLALLLAAACSLVLALNTDWGRHELVRTANGLMADSFKGKIQIREVGSVGFSGVSNVHGVVMDPAGRSVIAVHDLEVDVALLNLAWELLSAQKVTRIQIEEVNLQHARVQLVDTTQGVPSIARAFEAREPGPPSDSSTQVRIERVRFGHVWVHGSLQGQLIDADINELTGTLEVASATTIEVSGAQIVMRALPTQLAPEGRVAAKLVLPGVDSSDELRASGSFVGRGWDTRVTVEGRLEGSQIFAEVLAPAVEAGTIQRWVPGLEQQHPVALAANLEGTLEQPELALSASFGRASLRVRAVADTERRTARLDLELNQLDLSQLNPTAPVSTLSLRSNVRAKYSDNDTVTGRYSFELPKNRIEGHALPAAEIDGFFTVSPNGAWVSEGTVDVREPGARTQAQYEVSERAGPGSQVLHVATSTTLNDPPRLEDQLSGVRLAGQLETDIRYGVDSSQLKSSVTAKLSRVTAPSWSVANVDLDATATGTLERPELDLAATFGRIRVQERTFEEGSVRASGSPRRLALSVRAQKPAELALQATVGLKPELYVSGPRLSLQSEDSGTLQVSGRALRVTPSGIVAENLRLETTRGGSAEISVDYGPSLRTLAITAEDLNLARAAKILELGVELPSALITAEAQYDATDSSPSGYFRGVLKELGYGPIKGATAEVDVQLEQNMLDGKLDAAWRKSEFTLMLEDVVLPERLPTALADLSGQVALQASLELGSLSPLLDLPQVPLATAAGTIELDLELAHPRTRPATLRANLSTRGLELLGEEDPKSTEAEQDEPDQLATVWSVSGLDVDLALKADEAKGRLVLDAAVRDETSPLSRAELALMLPGDIQRRAFDEWPVALRQSEVQANVWLLPRKLSEWPEVVSFGSLEGVLSSSIHLTGTYEAPELRLMGRLANFGLIDQSRRGLVATFSGISSPRGGKINLGANAGARTVAVVRGDWKGDWIGYVLGEEGSAPEVQVKGNFDQLPMLALPLSAADSVRGHVSGEFAVKGPRTPIEGNLRLLSRDLSVQDIPVGDLSLTAAIEGAEVNSELRVSGGRLGRVNASLLGRVDLLGGGDPYDMKAALTAEDLQLGAFRPFLAGSVSGLAGTLDAKLSGRLAREDPSLRGYAEVKKASVQIPALGQMFHDINARVQVEPGKLDLTRLEASGLTGALKARGSARLDGLALSSAQAQLDIDEKEKLPLYLEGVALGDAWGSAEVRYSGEDERRQRVEVNVSNFHLELPELTPGGVQSLDPAEHIEVGVVTPAGDFMEIPLQPVEREEEGKPTRWLIAVDLGEVEVRKGPGIEVNLKGNLEARVGRQARLRGKIDLTGGRLDVSGKEFIVQSGSITFNGTEVDEGVIVAEARWESPLEYTVYARYSGTVQEGELGLRSEPPLTEDEILSLVMFGSPSGSFGAGSQGDTAAAVGIAGGTVAQGLNRALSRITQLEVSARVDTSTGESRPELVVQLTPRITGRVTQAIGEPAPGQSPDRTFVTFDLRLFRRWSLSARVGDEGASNLDLIWRHLY